jgi:hypothetical protein
MDDINNVFPIDSSKSLILVNSDLDTTIEVPEPIYVSNCLFILVDKITNLDFYI